MTSIIRSIRKQNAPGADLGAEDMTQEPELPKHDKVPNGRRPSYGLQNRIRPVVSSGLNDMLERAS
jgi:hypothetical protein